MIRLGEAIFRNPAAHAGRYLGNALTCQNCHLDAGRLADSSPLGPAYVMYPAYRTKTGRVETFAERLQGCFRYSMNGKEPPLGDPVLVALETYAYFLAKGRRRANPYPAAAIRSWRIRRCRWILRAAARSTRRNARSATG